MITKFISAIFFLVLSACSQGTQFSTSGGVVNDAADVNIFNISVGVKKVPLRVEATTSKESVIYLAFRRTTYLVRSKKAHGRYGNFAVINVEDGSGRTILLPRWYSPLRPWTVSCLDYANPGQPCLVNGMSHGSAIEIFITTEDISYLSEMQEAVDMVLR